MKHLLFLIFAVQACLPGFAACDGRVRIVPRPAEVEELPGSFRLTSRTPVVITDERLRTPAEIFARAVGKLTGAEPAVTAASEKHAVTLQLQPGYEAEEYLLEVGRQRITVTASTPQAVLHGLRSLQQLVAGGEIPACVVRDKPTFAYRGAMLDVCRHFFPVEDVKTYIDILSLHKINKFHWHLTDDQGWRIEIPCYPELTQEGAWRLFNRQDTLCMGRAAREQNDDFLLPVRRLRTDGADTLYGGYYTRKDIREVVAYAAVRGIDVIPEIDMPGHCLQAIDSYPWLACFGRGSWGQSFSSPLCVGKDRTLAFCESVWEELFELFPYEYVHMGGDEVDKSNWKRCPDCQTRMRAEGLPDEAALQAWFMHRMQRFCEARGRRMIGWDEILEGGAVPGATVMWWRPWEPQSVSAATRQGCEVVLCPQSWFYFSLEEDAN